MTEKVFKIAMLGNEGVGKTALLVRFLSHRFIGDYDPTIEDCYRRTVRVDEDKVIIDVLDTACRNSTSKLKKNFLSIGDGFVVAYSVTDRKSYITIPRYKEMIQESRDQTNPDPVSVVLIGTKTDLGEHRTVSENEGRTLAERYGWMFGETSAAEYEGVDEMFCDLIREIRAKPETDIPSSGSEFDSQAEDSASEIKHHSPRFIKKKLSFPFHHKKALFARSHSDPALLKGH